MDPACNSARQMHHSPPPSVNAGGMQRGAAEWNGLHRQRQLDHHMQSSDTGNNANAMVLQTSSPMPTNSDPVKWSREEVHNWLKWCQEEFSLDSVNADKFTMNGKALCLMPMQSFRDRAPECGDILYELLQKLFRKECKFYHSSSEQNTPNQRRSPESQAYYANSRTSDSQNASHSPSGQTREEANYHGNLTLPASTSSPRLPIDLSAPVHIGEKSNTPCSDSGHSSPDTAEDLRLANNNPSNSGLHGRRHNAPPMITLTPTTTATASSLPQRAPHHQVRMLAGKSHLDLVPMDECVPTSPTKRFRADFSSNSQHHASQHHASAVSAFAHHHAMGHIELRHNERLAHEQQQQQQQHPRQGLHPITAARLLGRRRLSSDESMMGRASPSSFASERGGGAAGGLVGGGGAAYHHGNGSAIPVNCTIPGLASAGSAILSRLQHRRNSTGGTEGLADGFPPGPQHGVPVSDMPRRRSMDLDDVFLMEDDAFETRKAAGGDCRLLWDFLVQLLKNKTYVPYIRWEDPHQRVFRILDPVQIANLWGLQKNRTNMTYEKLSRALRYYYKMGILQKEQGQKLTYRFLQDPKDIANSQRFSKTNRSKEAMEQSDIPLPPPSSTSTSSPLHHPFSSSAAAASSTSVSASMLSSPIPTSISMSAASRLYASGLHGLHPSPSQRASPHQNTATPSPTATAPPTDISLATHQSIEGVSMMALTPHWMGSKRKSTAMDDDDDGEVFRVKEEPRSRPSSPAMES